MRIASGVTDQFIYFKAVDPDDLTTAVTGLSSFTVYRSRNGGAAASFTTPTINETDATNMPGIYELLLDEDMSIDAGDEEQEMALHITEDSDAMHPVDRVITIFRVKITAGNTLGVESDGDLTKVNTLDGHTAQTGDSFARIGAAGASLTDLGGMSTAMKAEVKAEATNALNGFAPLGTTTGAINDGSAGAGSFATDLVENTDDHYNGGWLVFTTGDLTGQPGRRISDYDGSTSTISLEVDLLETPSNGDEFIIYPANAIWDELQADHATAGTFGEMATELASVLVDTAEIGAAGAGLTDLGGMSTAMKAEVNAEADTALSDYDGPTKAELDTAVQAFSVRKNTALANFPFVMYDTDGDPATSLTVTCERSIDGAAFAACANADAELSDGVYVIDLAASDLNGDTIMFKFTASGAKTTFITVTTHAT